MTDHTFDPDEGTGSSVLAALKAAVRSQGASTKLRNVHPRRDRMWIERVEGDYTLTLRRTDEVFEITSQALSQIGALLDVPMPLLRRLREIDAGKQEDCRLLNHLLWHAGATPTNSYQLRLDGARIFGMFSGGYTTMHLPTLIRELEVAEQSGDVRLARFDINSGHEIRLVVLFPNLEPVALHNSSRSGQVYWQPGAVLTNREDGSRAVTIVPALVAPYAKRVLPVISGKQDVSRHRHHGLTPGRLASRVTDDLLSARRAAFASAGRRFVSLNRRRVNPSQLAATIDAMNLPLTDGLRSRLRQATRARSTSQFWILMNLAGLLDELTPTDRLRIEIAYGRLVWARGRDAT